MIRRNRPSTRLRATLRLSKGRIGAAIRQRYGSQGPNTTRGIAPAAFPLRDVLGSLHGSGQPASVRQRRVRSATGREGTSAGAKRSDRSDFECRDTEVFKLTSERQRSAAAPFRLKRSLGFVAEPMLYRRPANPSRRRIVSPPVETSVFRDAKRRIEPTASFRRPTDTCQLV